MSHLATLNLIGHKINSLFDLAPLCLCDISRSGCTYIIRVSIIFPPWVQCSCITLILPTPLNIMLPINSLIFIIHIHGCSPKHTFTFYMIFYYPPGSPVSWSWVTNFLYPKDPSVWLSYCGFLNSISIYL